MSKPENTEKPHVSVHNLTYLLVKAYKIDVNTAMFIATSFFGNLIGPGLRIRLPNADIHSCEMKVSMMESHLCQERYGPIIEHIHSFSMAAQTERLKMHQAVNAEALKTNILAESVKVRDAQFEVLKAETRVKEAEKKQSKDLIQADAAYEKAKAMHMEQLSAFYSMQWVQRPLQMLRRVTPAIMDKWREIGFDNFLNLYGRAHEVFQDYKARPTSRRLPHVNTFTDEHPDAVLCAHEAGTQLTLPMKISTHLTFPVREGRYADASSRTINEIIEKTFVLAPLPPADVEPSHLELDAPWFTQTATRILRHRTWREVWAVRIPVDVFLEYQQFETECQKKLYATQSPFLRTAYALAPAYLLKSLGVWAFLDKSRTVSVPLFNHALTMIRALVEKLAACCKEPYVEGTPMITKELIRLKKKLRSDGPLTMRQLQRKYDRIRISDLKSLVSEAKAAGLVAVLDEKIMLVGSNRQ